MKSQLIALVLAACGDNGAAPDARATVDSPASSTDGGPTTLHAVTVAPSASFGVPPGILSALNLSTLTMKQNISAGTIGSDPVLKKIGDKLYIVNRGENNVTVLDAATFDYLGQLGTGAASNPQDVAVVGDKLYIPALGTTGVVVGKLGETATTTIDLHTILATNTTQPDCVAAFAVGTDVYVACENLNNGFQPVTNGLIAVIDSTTDTVRTHFSLPVKNPQSLMHQLPDNRLVVSTYDAMNGCIAAITPGATPTAACLTTNTLLGGEPTTVVLEGTKIWVAYTTNFTDGWVRAYDTASSTFAPVMNAAAETLRDLTVCPDGKLVVADFTGNGGLRVYDGATELTTAEVPIGLKVGFGNGLVCY